MTPPRKKKADARVPREDPGEVSSEKGADGQESQTVRVRSDEQHGGSSREQDNPIGQTDAGEARQGQQSGQAEEVVRNQAFLSQDRLDELKVAHTSGGPYDSGIHNHPLCPGCAVGTNNTNAGLTGEQWRGIVGRVTYRTRITAPTNLLPSRLVLERLISHAGEDEAWEAEWGIK